MLILMELWVMAVGIYFKDCTYLLLQLRRLTTAQIMHVWYKLLLTRRIDDHHVQRRAPPFRWTC